MKKQIIFGTLAVAAFFFANNIQAQNNTATTTVNLHLSDVISIDSGAAIGGVVDFNYTTATDYNSDQEVDVANSLVVTSTKNFDIKVKADGANFTDGSNTIPVDVLTVKAVNSASNPMGGTKNSVVLSTDDQVLVSNAALGSQLVLDLNYKIPASESSSSKILGKPAGTYTQTVTYTATAL